MADRDRSLRLHTEAQQRYLEKLRRRRAPTTSVIWLSIGRSFAAAQCAHSVNTAMGRDLIEQVLQDALERLVAAGYDRDQSLARMRQALVSKPMQEADADLAMTGPMPGM